MLQIACIDKTSTARLELQAFLDAAIEESRSTVGHIPLGHPYPTSLKELTVSGTTPDVVVVGPNFSPDEAFHCCREILEQYPSAARLLILTNDDYSLSSVRKFKKVATEIFSKSEPSIRLIHTFWSLIEKTGHQTKGRLIIVKGAKGGVGVSSAVTGIAHAFESLGKSSLIIDLSPFATLLHYANTNQISSPEFADLLIENKRLETVAFEKLITVAPNGLTFLLPPAGGRETRELWTRDPSRLDLALSIVDIALDKYDIVIVDSANTEGILQFALSIRADSTLLITTNEPASVHLLAHTLKDLRSIPSASNTHILINRFIERGLTKNDIVDFLTPFNCFRNEFCAIPELVPDNRGILWIGTGNTLYTEGSRKTQLTLQSIARQLSVNQSSYSSLLSSVEVCSPDNQLSPLFISDNLTTHRATFTIPREEGSNTFKIAIRSMHRRLFKGKRKDGVTTSEQQLFTSSTTEIDDHFTKNQDREKIYQLTSRSTFQKSELSGAAKFHNTAKELSTKRQDLSAISFAGKTSPSTSSFSFSQPKELQQRKGEELEKLNDSQAGTLSLEIILLIGAAIIFSATLLPSFTRNIRNYSAHFTEADGLKAPRSELNSNIY